MTDDEQETVDLVDGIDVSKLNSESFTDFVDQFLTSKQPSIGYRWKSDGNICGQKELRMPQDAEVEEQDNDENLFSTRSTMDLAENSAASYEKSSNQETGCQSDLTKSNYDTQNLKTYQPHVEKIEEEDLFYSRTSIDLEESSAIHDRISSNLETDRKDLTKSTYGNQNPETYQSHVEKVEGEEDNEDLFYTRTSSIDLEGSSAVHDRRSLNPETDRNDLTKSTYETQNPDTYPSHTDKIEYQDDYENLFYTRSDLEEPSTPLHDERRSNFGSDIENDASESTFETKNQMGKVTENRLGIQSETYQPHLNSMALYYRSTMNLPQPFDGKKSIKETNDPTHGPIEKENGITQITENISSPEDIESDEGECTSLSSYEDDSSNNQIYSQNGFVISPIPNHPPDVDKEIQQKLLHLSTENTSCNEDLKSNSHSLMSHKSNTSQNDLRHMLLQRKKKSQTRERLSPIRDTQSERKKITRTERVAKRASKRSKRNLSQIRENEWRKKIESIGGKGKRAKMSNRLLKMRKLSPIRETEVKKKSSRFGFKPMDRDELQALREAREARVKGQNQR